MLCKPNLIEFTTRDSQADVSCAMINLSVRTTLLLPRPFASFKQLFRRLVMSTDAECPALTLVEETGVDSPHVLRQTKAVYDSMLTDKWRKQAVALLARKQQLDVECNHIAETAGVQR